MRISMTPHVNDDRMGDRSLCRGCGRREAEKVRHAMNVMKFWESWLPGRRRTARVETAAAVSRARKALLHHQKLARTAQITGSADDRHAADVARRYCQHRWFAIGEAMRSLPKREQELVRVWDHAAAMTWWHRTGDRQGWARFEAAAAQVIAALPDGVSSDAVAAVIETNARRCELELQRWSDIDPDPSVPGGPEPIDQNELLNLLRENQLQVLTDESGSVRADEALRYFEPWLCESIMELSRPQSQDRLLEIADRWRALRVRFSGHVAGRSDPTPACRTASGQHHAHPPVLRLRGMPPWHRKSPTT